MSDPAREELALSIVIPAYEELENLPALLEAVRRAADATGRAYEIVLVDDASADGSAEWLAAEARRDPRLRAFALERHGGQSAALMAGIARARGGCVVTLDADLQNDPADLSRVLAALEGADVVSGIRATRHDTWVRRASSAVANRVRRAVLGDSITDIGCSFKAYRREFLEGVPAFDGVHRFLPALCAFRGARVAEVAVSHHPRRRGTSKYGVSNRLWRGIRDLMGVRWLHARQVSARARELGR